MSIQKHVTLRRIRSIGRNRQVAHCDVGSGLGSWPGRAGPLYSWMRPAGLRIGRFQSRDRPR